MKFLPLNILLKDERMINILMACSEKTTQDKIKSVISKLEANIYLVDTDHDITEYIVKKKINLVILTLNDEAVDPWRFSRLVRSEVYNAKIKLPIILIEDSICKQYTKSIARDFKINLCLPISQIDNLPNLINQCLSTPNIGLEKKKLLIIEDYKDTAKMIEKILSPQYEVTIAHDGESGIEAWENLQYDLVLLDVMLPGISGSSVLNTIREQNKTQPVVMMTAYGSLEMAQLLMNQGATDFISKPFTAGKIKEICELIFKRLDYTATVKELTSMHT